MFKLLNKRSFEDGSSSVVILSHATRKDHNDIHYLYKMRKAMILLVGEEGMKGYSEQQLEELHKAIVKILIDNGTGHWYDEWDSDLDEKLPDDLKLASSGYDPPKDQSMFDLEEYEYRKFLEETDALFLWTAPAKRKNVPSNHFLDPKNKKYPYKSSDGTISCGGLQAAYNAARGARSGKKSLTIAAKAKSLLAKHCSKEKKSESCLIAKLV